MKLSRTELTRCGEILIIDDVPSSLGVLAGIINQAGYQTRAAYTGPQALKIIQDFPPELILLDIIMPQMDGYAVCQALKESPTTADIPIIFISCLDNAHDKIKAFELGGVDYITKPFEVNEVLARVETHLSLRFMQRQLNGNNLALREAQQQLETRVQQRTASLQTSEKRFRAVAQSANDAIITINKLGIIVFWNAAAEKMFDWSATEIIGQLVDNIMPAPYRGQHKKGLRRLVAGGLPQLPNGPIELMGLRQSGEQFPIELSLSFWDSNNEPFYTSIIRDISERKEEEEKKAALEAQLNQAHQMEVIGLMAGGVAHDLNNILSGIVGYPQLLLLQLSANSPLRPALEAMQDSGQRATAVVADLLTVARGAAGKREIVNVNTLIEEYLDSPEHKKLSERCPGTQCKIQLDPQVKSISCSTVHLKKCLMNLILNALEANDQAGICLISSHNQHIDSIDNQRLQLKEGDYVLITIQDNGPGIPAKDIDHIFEPFYTKKQMGKSGTGLGLTIVWNTLRDHQGTITVKSDANGTQFTLYFPTTEQPLPKSCVQPEPLLQLNGQGEHILIIDDEPLLRDIASDMLTTLGYQVTAIASGEQAVMYLRKHKIDLILLDMIMPPGWNGYETYQAILRQWPSQKALLVSGFSSSTEVKKTLQLGASGFIKKPYSIETLGKAVQEVLQST